MSRETQVPRTPSKAHRVNGGDADTAKSAKKRGRNAEEKQNGHKKSKHAVQEDSHTATSKQISTSPFHVITTSFYLALSPIAQKQPLEGLCAEHLSPLLLTYYPPLKGIVISYSNARLTRGPSASTTGEGPIYATSIAEYAVSFAWVCADFVMLKPEPGNWAEGFVNVQNRTHIGIVCWNYFNARVDASSLPRGWKWIENAGEGTWVDEQRKPLEGVVKFRIKDFESAPAGEKERGFMLIEGTFLTDEEEKEVAEREKNSSVVLKGLLKSRPRPLQEQDPEDY